jgi:hypothetical protein
MSCSRFAGWCACELLTDLDGLCHALHCMLAVSATRLALPEKGEAVCGCQRRAGWWGGMVGWWCRLIGEPIKPHTHARVQLAPRNEIKAPPPACRAAFPTHHRSLPTVVCLFSQPHPAFERLRPPSACREVHTWARPELPSPRLYTLITRPSLATALRRRCRPPLPPTAP